MVALQVGCTQKPAAGAILGISGSPFTRAALEVTDGKSNENEDPGASPNSLTTGTIVGIAVGVALFVFGGLALWFVYRRKKRSTLKDQDQNGGAEDPNSRSSSRTMISHAQPWAAPDHKKSSSVSSSRASNYADPYAEKDEGARNKRTINNNHHTQQYSQYSHNYNHSRSFSGHSSSIPTHPAYNPMSRDGRSSATPSPQPNRNHPGAYNLNTSSNHPLRNQVQNFSRTHSREPSADSRASTPQPPHPTEQAAATLPEGFTMPPPPPRAAQVPSIAIPSLGRARGPKKYTPPTLTLEPATPDEASSSSQPRYLKVDASLDTRDAA